MRADAAAQDERLLKAFERERTRLKSFIRRHVANIDAADDILQDVFYELVRAERLMEPIEHAGAWLVRRLRRRLQEIYNEFTKN